MTTPNISGSTAKSWVALIGSALSFIVPYLTDYKDLLPPPWPMVIGALLAVGTWAGVFQTPYKPKDTVLVPAPYVPPVSGGGGVDPWQ